MFSLYFTQNGKSEFESMLCRYILCKAWKISKKKAYGEYSLFRAHVFHWHNIFMGDVENVKGEQRPGRPSTSQTDENMKPMKPLV